MASKEQEITVPLDDRAGLAKSLLISAVSLIRMMPLLVRERPKTPLRVLCLAAFDTLHFSRYSKRLTETQILTLATFLDLGASANTFFDDKYFDRVEYRATRQFLRATGRNSLVRQYLASLRTLESQRPDTVTSKDSYQIVKFYRESVIRLSLGMLAAIAFELRTLEEAINEVESDSGLLLLFRMVMQCQVIDDALDYRVDRSKGLPSFYNVAGSTVVVAQRVRSTIKGYSEHSVQDSLGCSRPLRIALRGVSIISVAANKLFAIRMMKEKWL